MSILNLKNILQGTQTAGFFLSKDVVIHGNLDAASFGRIDGIVMGDLRSQDKLVIGESASVNGNIDAAETLVFGKVEGNITCSKKVVIANTAQVKGRINCAAIEIEEGARVEEAKVQQKKPRSKTSAPAKGEPVTAVSKVPPPAEDDTIECWF